MPQDRRRLILLGSRDGDSSPGLPGPDEPRPVSRAGKPQIVTPLSTLGYGPSVLDAIPGDLPDIEKFESLFETDLIPRRLRREGPDYALRSSRRRLVDPEDYSHPRIWAEELSQAVRVLPTLRSQDLGSPRQFRVIPNRSSRFYRLPPEGLCNTLPERALGSERGAFTSPRPIHPEFPRCISVREAARLHSFPDWFRFHRTIWHGFRQDWKLRAASAWTRDCTLDHDRVG